jgi:hypothetical protein
VAQDAPPLVFALKRHPERKSNMSSPPLPPFTQESAIEKVPLAEDGWNSRDPAKLALAYTLDPGLGDFGF